jgi:hypothetical protein
MLTWFPHCQTEGRSGRPEREIILNPSVIFRRTRYRLAILTMFPAGIVQETCWWRVLSHVSYYADGNIPHYPMSYPFVILIHGYTAS